MNKLAFFLFFFLLSCESRDSTTHFLGNTMTMEYRVVVGKRLNQKEKDQVQAILLQTFQEVDTIYNRWNPSSELSWLNSLKAHQKVKISIEMEHLLELTQEIVTLTEGRFDPSIEPLQKLWKESLEKGMIPTDQALSECLPSIGFSHIHFYNGFFWKDSDMCSLDLGGIAKGYCVDLIIQRVSKAGYRDLFVEWGGEIHAVGSHPEGRPWKIFISRFGDTHVENAIAIIPLKDEAIATSGDYLQNWCVGEIHYCHIIDPKAHHPLVMTKDSIGSSSVVASSCALADGLATAAMLFSNIEETKLWICKIQEKHPETQFWIVPHSF